MFEAGNKWVNREQRSKSEQKQQCFFAFYCKRNQYQIDFIKSPKFSTAFLLSVQKYTESLEHFLQNNEICCKSISKLSLRDLSCMTAMLSDDQSDSRISHANSYFYHSSFLNHKKVLQQSLSSLLGNVHLIFKVLQNKGQQFNVISIQSRGRFDNPISFYQIRDYLQFLKTISLLRLG